MWGKSAGDILISKHHSVTLINKTQSFAFLIALYQGYDLVGSYDQVSGKTNNIRRCIRRVAQFIISYHYTEGFERTLDVEVFRSIPDLRGRTPQHKF